MVFVVSTTGQGDPPDTVKVCLKSHILRPCLYCTSNNIGPMIYILYQDFWKFLLRRSLNSDWLDHLNYVVFGLGDSSYAQYNVSICFSFSHNFK